MRIGVLLLASPFGKLVQAVLDGDAVAAGLVPGGCLLLLCGAFGLGDEQVGDTKGNVEGALKDLRGRVHGAEDVGLGLVLVSFERRHIGAVGGDAHERDLARAGTSGRLANGGRELNTGTVASGLQVVLSLEHGRDERWRRGGRLAAGAHAGVDWVVFVCVEDELVGRASDVGRSLLEFHVLAMAALAHVRVAEDDHEVLVAHVDGRVVGHARGRVARGRLDMVVVVVHGKGALEQRIQSVVAQGDARPAYIVPSVAPLEPRLALVNLVLQAVYWLLARYRAIRVEVGDAGAVDKKVVVWLEAQAHALARDVKGKVERRHGCHAMCVCEDVGILDKCNALQRSTGVRGGCCYSGKANGEGSLQTAKEAHSVGWGGGAPAVRRSGQGEGAGEGEGEERGRDEGGKTKATATAQRKTWVGRYGEQCTRGRGMFAQTLAEAQKALVERTAAAGGRRGTRE